MRLGNLHRGAFTLFIFLLVSNICYTQYIDSYYTENINELDIIEGVWDVKAAMVLIEIATGEVSGEENWEGCGYFDILKQGNNYIASSQNYRWNFDIHKTAISTLFLVDGIILRGFNIYANVEFKLQGGAIVEFSYKLNYNQEDEVNQHIKDQFSSKDLKYYSEKFDIYLKHKWIKVYPDAEAIEKIKSESQEKVIEGGTGFAISKDGYIATNYHVVENSNTILVKGINGNYNEGFSAQIIYENKDTDIAILKVSPSVISNGSVIPFVLSVNEVEVGEEVYALGYPLRGTMGDEIKLTDGLISSSSGFMGNKDTYQISAPIQPGNSGGPLFTKNGELIGITYAYHEGAENVSYAIKSPLLSKVLDKLSITYNTSYNNLKGKALKDQVKLVKEFVYIIETR